MNGYTVEAHVLSPKPFTGERAQGHGSSVRIAVQRASARLAHALGRRNKGGRALIEYNIIARPERPASTAQEPTET